MTFPAAFYFPPGVEGHVWLVLQQRQLSELCMAPHVALCSMFRHSQYYEEHRAHRLIRTLFAWVVLEAHDKKCWARVMKGHTPSVSTDQAAEYPVDGHTHSRCSPRTSPHKPACLKVAPMESLHSALAEMSLGLSTGVILLLRGCGRCQNPCSCSLPSFSEPRRVS